MAMVIHRIINRQSQTKWFFQSDVLVDQRLASEAMKQYDAWEKSQEGLMSQYTKVFNINSFETILIFDTEENGKKFLADRNSHPTYLAQQLYFNENNITVSEIMF